MKKLMLNLLNFLCIGPQQAFILVFLCVCRYLVMVDFEGHCILMGERDMMNLKKMTILVLLMCDFFF